jgi:hypothetical protein
LGSTNICTCSEIPFSYTDQRSQTSDAHRSTGKSYRSATSKAYTTEKQETGCVDGRCTTVAVRDKIENAKNSTRAKTGATLQDKGKNSEVLNESVKRTPSSHADSRSHAQEIPCLFIFPQKTAML